jgi:hypothetical protein
MYPYGQLLEHSRPERETCDMLASIMRIPPVWLELFFL